MTITNHHIDHGPLLADVQEATRVIAPYWPVSSFVAVNPLGGLEDQDFQTATAMARDLHGANTHLSLADYRREYAAGAITDADLERAIVAHDPIRSTASIPLGTAKVSLVDVLHHDLLHGPHPDIESAPLDPATRAIDDYLSTWCATYVDTGSAAWALPHRDDGFYIAWRRAVEHDRNFVRIFGSAAAQWISLLGDDPLDALQHALDHAGITDDERVEAIRRLTVRLPGWAGYARWCDDWAAPDAPGPRLRMVDLVAVRAAVEAAIGQLRRPPSSPGSAPTDAALQRERVDSIIQRWATGIVTDAQRVALGAALEQVPHSTRLHLWLEAHERHFRDRLLELLRRSDTAGRSEAPDAQLVMCIDVRSEGMRRNLEAIGDYETFGFAGFFGVPVRWRPLGSNTSEARCPVLVSPRHEVAEEAIADLEAFLGREAARGAAEHSVHDAKKHLAAPFALAEAGGWITGPLAALRTFLPGGRRPRRDRKRPSTAPAVEAEIHGSGLTVEERTLFAEAIVRTIGMTRFAPIVLLCGHASATVNNPHASSLDCGACGGAPGGASARIAASILNDPDVRAELAARGTEIPQATWFAAAEHDTVSDRVTVLDRDRIPAHHLDAIDQLEDDLGTAGRRHAAERAARLSTGAGPVERRGQDWAQVRPEWGLAGNAAMVIGPRSITAEVDLADRTFLHSYDADTDPDFVALETIMTAPLVVAQWISSQYYFSTVDNDVFGAGDKMIHNPVGGTIGVLRGGSGDLAVGLPLQSTAAGDRRGHDPLRLLAVIQAPLENIDAVIARNPGLRQLVEGEWIRIAARSHRCEQWSVRSPAGAWEAWHPSAAVQRETISLRMHQWE